MNVNCDNYQTYTNTLGKRMGCNGGDISNRKTINPCNEGDLDCFRRKGYFQLVDTPDDQPNINFCKNNRYQDNDGRVMGVDNYFPYNNDIILSPDLASQIKFRSQVYNSYTNQVGGYIKYDILTDNIAHISVNTRQGSDEIALCGIMRGVSVDPDFAPEPLSNQHIQVSFNLDDPAHENPNYKAVGNQVIKVEDKLNNVLIQFDNKNSTFGELHLYEYDFNQYDHYVYGLGPVSDGNREFSLNWLNRNNGIRCNSAFGNHQVFGIIASHWPVFYIQRYHKQTGNSSVYAVFFDHYRKLEYDFSSLNSSGVIKISSREPEFRFFVITGKNLSDVKANYMKIIGNPSVPNVKLLGLWIGGFGYRNIDQMYYTISKLTQSNFPLDGFYLDLYWYGHLFPEDYPINKKEYSENICFEDALGACVGSDYIAGNTQNINVSKGDQVGIFNWDTVNFPTDKINELYEKNKYGITLIYEPYYNLNSLDMSDLYAKNLLAKDKNTRFIAPDSVWKHWLGSVIVPDFTQEESGKYWYETRMKSRITGGTFMWWNDLGEPEVYNQNAIYNGVGPVIDDKLVALSCYTQHPSVQNYVQLLWTRGVSKAYRADTGRRYNVLTRAGAPGISRYGAYSWTGDTYASSNDLVAHIKNMGTLGLSGQDLICSDAGGFNGGKDSATEFLYSYWLANCCATEITVKPHKWFNAAVQTSSPAEWGDIATNLKNIQMRYSLIPYYYSTVYSITKNGQRSGRHFSCPVFMAYSEKRLNDDPFAGANYLIGDNLLIPLFLPDGTQTQDRQVLLPSNENWYDLNNKSWVNNSIVLSGQNAVMRPLVKNNTIIVQSVLPYDLTVVRSEDIFNYPFNINIFCADNDLSKVQPFYLYIDDGKTEQEPTIVIISLKDNACRVELINYEDQFNPKINNVNIYTSQRDYSLGYNIQKLSERRQSQGSPSVLTKNKNILFSVVILIILLGLLWFFRTNKNLKIVLVALILLLIIVYLM